MNTTFEYDFARVRDLVLRGDRNERTGRIEPRSVYVQGQETKPTKRFWKSFFQRFGVSENIFRYFDPAEVFDRISHRAADDSMRVCIERTPDEQPKLLAVSSPRRPVIRSGEIQALVERYGCHDTTYHEGVVTSTHTPRGGNQTFSIGPDRFQHRFVMETPVDGFSQPKIHLSFLRMICSNGAIGYSRAFRSDISLGKDIAHCLGRALESYDNGDGYDALRQRFESAQTSWASVQEASRLYKLLGKLRGAGEVTKETVLRDLNRVAGNLQELYGLANLDALSTKRQRVLPAKCRVYDLLNFASEAATHHATVSGNRTLQAFIGSLISDEYDLEGAAMEASEFADFFIPGGDPERN